MYKKFGIVTGIIAFAICLFAGIAAIGVGLEREFMMPIGFYFFGKAFFVGPALVLLGARADNGK